MVESSLLIGWFVCSQRRCGYLRTASRAAKLLPASSPELRRSSINSALLLLNRVVVVVVAVVVAAAAHRKSQMNRK